MLIKFLGEEQKEVSPRLHRLASLLHAFLSSTTNLLLANSCLSSSDLPRFSAPPPAVARKRSRP